MANLRFETLIAAPLESVWEFHENVTDALPALSPKQAGVRIVSADVPIRAGSRIVISAEVLGGIRVKWAAMIVAHEPPENGKARFVDEQESGPFACWRHEHEFQRVGEQSTRLIDRVTYRVPLGIFGSIADRLFVRRKVIAMFAHRHAVTRRLLELKILAAKAQRIQRERT